MDTTDKIKNLKKRLTEAKELVVENNQDPNFRAWKKLTLRTLCKIFGKESNEATEFEKLNFQFHSTFWICGEDYTDKHLKQFREDLEVTIQLLKNYIKEFEHELQVENKTDKKQINNNMRIFISHSSEDKEYGNALVNLLTGIGIKNNDIIFTSNKVYDIEPGKDIYEYLREKINEKPFVIYLLSPRYYKSIACLNEMGAVWIKRSESVAFFTPDFNLDCQEFHNCVLNSRKMGSHIEDKNDILKFIDSLVRIFKINYSLPLINKKVSQYLSEINNITPCFKKAENKQESQKTENTTEPKSTKFIKNVQNKKFSDDEILLIRFIYDTGKYNLYENSMLKDEIREWEKENGLNNYLTKKCFQALDKLIARKLAVEKENYDFYEARIIEEIKDIIIDFPEFLQKATDEVMKKNFFELPF